MLFVLLGAEILVQVCGMDSYWLHVREETKVYITLSSLPEARNLDSEAS